MNRLSRSILAISIILFGLDLFISIPGLTESAFENYVKRNHPTADAKIYTTAERPISIYDRQPLRQVRQVISVPFKKAPYTGPANIINSTRQGGDNIATAIVINSLPYSDEGTTTGFNDDYDVSCEYVSSGSPDVVYSYTPDSDEVLEISLCDSEYDTKLLIFENSIDKKVYCNEDACGWGGYRSAIWGAELIGGNTYYIIIDGYDGDHGNYELFVDYYERPDIECPIDATDEGELYGCEYPDIFNGGCWSEPPVFSPISFGETVCGTAGNFQQGEYLYRDVDWYELVVEGNAFVTFSIQAEFAPLIGMVLTDPPGSGNCNDWTGYLWDAAVGAPGDNVSIFATLAPGTYWLWVSSSDFYTAPCDAKYIASVTGETDAINCPPNGISEGEPSGCDNPDVTNGGCSLDVPLFSYINCGDTICGTSGYYYDIQTDSIHCDEDWYQFEVSDITTIKLSVFAEFPMFIQLVYPNIDGLLDCDHYSYTWKIAPAFDSAYFRRSLSPGTHWILMRPYFYVPVYCNASYTAILSCENEIDPTLGKCCYGDPRFPDCDNLSLYNCWTFPDFISWDSLADCNDPCMAAEMGQCCYGNPFSPSCIEEIQVDCENKIDFISWSADADCSDPCSALLFDQSDIFSGSFRDIDAVDIDKDNNTDLIVTDYYPEERWNLRIAYGRGDGTFETPNKVLSDYDIFSYAFVNNDDLMDIVALGRKSSIFHNSIAVLINQGNRDFTISYYQHDNDQNVSSTGMAVGYFNDDTYADIATPPNKVYFGNSEGTFDVSNSATLPSACYSVDIGDFNNDGFDDIIGISSTYQAEIYTSDGAGNFSKTGNFDLPGWTIDVTTANSLADFNRDGNVDVATVVNVPDARSFVLIGYGDGQGAISFVKTLTFKGASRYMTAADVNRDNNLDLVACDGANRKLQIYYGDEYGNFDEHISADIGMGLYPVIIATGDFDRDGNPDFVAGKRQNGSILDAPSPLRLLLNTLPDAPVIENPEFMMVTTGYDNVSIEVENPDMFNISRNYTTIAGSDYWRFDYDKDGKIDETAIDYNLQYGEYEIKISPRNGADMDGEFSTGIRIDGTDMATIFHNYQLSDFKKGAKGVEDFVFYYEVEAESSIQPPNGGASDPQPAFDWSGLLDRYPSSESYSFQICPYYDFSRSINEITDISATFLNLDNPLGNDSVFYWRVIGSGWSDYSRTFAVYINDDVTDIFDENDDEQSKLPSEFRLYQNYPNPFNSMSSISFSLPYACDKVTLGIYNILGQKIIELVNGSLNAGNYTVQWNGMNCDGECVSSGVYFYRIEAGEFAESKKMLLLK